MNKKLVFNALSNAIQMILSAIILFILYRYIVVQLGVDNLGVWSVVLATASTSRLADLGLSASVTRFVAKYIALDNKIKAQMVVETAISSLMMAFLIIIPIIYLLSWCLLPYFFSSQYLTKAQNLVPFALISLWIGVIANIYQSAIDGVQRMVTRAFIVVASQIVLLIGSVLLISKYQLVGLALAQIIQSFFLLVANKFYLKRHLPQTQFFWFKWDKSTFNEMFKYGLNIQIGSIVSLLFDPVTKALMAKFGGPSMAGYFEIANQIVTRVRSVIVTANQSIIPYITELETKIVSKSSTFYIKNVHLLIFLSFPIFSVLYISSPVLSYLVISEVSNVFLFMLKVLIIAWLINLHNVPAFFINMGSGDVSWNTLSGVIMGISNLFLASLLGFYFGTIGVLMGYISSLIFSSILLVVVFNKKHNIDNLQLFMGKECLPIIIISFISVIAYEVLNSVSEISFTEIFIFIGIMTIAQGFVIWRNSMLRGMIEKILAR